MLVILVNFAFDERADLPAGTLAAREIGEMMDNRGHLLIEPLFEQSDSLSCDCFGQRSAAVGQVVKPSADKLPYCVFKPGLTHQPLETFFDEADCLIERF